MSNRSITLDVIDVARPCPVDWNKMRGDERVRFCKHCSLHVYNLSAMSRSEAERLVADAEGRTCVRFYRRSDGTVTTQDCDGWWRVARKRVSRWSSAVVALLITVVGLTRWSSASATVKPDAAANTVAPASAAVMGDVIMGRIRPPTSQPIAIMGEIAPPAPPIAPPASQPATQPSAAK